MKILIGSTPATGHVNPMLAIARILMTDGHEVTAKALARVSMT
jgi:UDP:flavonoid glycosyltransferase YjiC (YdhE family)